MESAAPEVSRYGARLGRSILERWADVPTLLRNPELYIQLLLIGLALALAWLVSVLITRRVRAHVTMHPPRRISAEQAVRLSVLVAPLLALVYLSVVRPVGLAYSPGAANLIDPASRLCFAWLLARSTMLLVRTRPMGNFIALIIMVVALLDTTGFTRPATEFLRSLDFRIGGYNLSLYNIIQGAVILIIVFWMAGVLSRTLEGYLRHSSKLSYNARELIVKFFTLFVYFMALLITLSALGVDLTAFAVFGGALGVGVGLGLQKITANFVSGVTLLLEKSIQIGDILEVGAVSGWVRQLNIRYALVETLDGREVLIPNEELVSTRVINWTHSNNLARIDITVGVAYGSDPQLVMRLMLEAALDQPRTLKKEREPSCFLREFGDSSLKFLLTFWVADVRDGRYGVQSDVMMTILKKFKEHDIEIPYPQQVVRLQRESHGAT